ncbi:class I SAM-dependent DNA methyltransferase [Pseudodesulfovibrio indicus]|uniref:Methyltransferase family protein n=1 Tax=Pseudodesulfovibrio indicus TaxID=1716143 RepID=A0A126QRH5_9BACT|nr:class I SAM-dependent methyltransferase [Pseudodesulfovibrio indicus]AMK12306.1 methyltransferase type 11 [Pseudodesulfovibrio indicus]TDT90587.1 methyltransferase family protein [Pseudodesulfovibrio indicus]
MVSDNKTLDKVYTADNHKDLMEAYGDWAENYDADTVEAFGYVAPEITARALERVVPVTSARILDAGCGTGQVAEALRSKGYGDLHALDYSSDMLKVAEEKKVYRSLKQADLSKPLDIEDDAYDAVVCVGTLTYGHVDAAAFDELIRVTRPDGHICFTIREGAYEDYGYRDRMIALERADAWELVSMEDADYLRNENVGCKLCTYKVTAGGSPAVPA